MLFFTLVSIILFFFCLYLYFDNKKLKQKIINLEEETKVILERKIINSKEDLVSIDNISIAKYSSKEENALNVSAHSKEDKEINKIPTDSFTHKNKKYIARTNEDEYVVPNIPKPTSTILTTTSSQINKEHKLVTTDMNQKDIKSVPNNKSVSMTIDFNPNEFIKTNSSSLEQSKLKTTKNNDYLKDIAKQLEGELTPQTVDLTDYEKEQEDHAIISYKELLSLKEKSNNEAKFDKSLLEDLKSLRNLLEKQNT